MGSVSDIRIDLIPEHSLLPLQLRSLQILQMGFDELASYVMAQAWQNPMIELEYYEEWLGSPSRRGAAEPDAPSWVEQQADRAERRNSLRAHLYEQLPLKNFDGARKSALTGLIDSLDERGYLRDTPEELSRIWRIPRSALEQALDMLQTLEPAGVGARNLRECLRLQALRADAGAARDRDVLRIIDGYLELVAKGQYAGICKALRISRERVMSAVERIKRMNPCPGAGFDPPQPSIPVIPDLIVEEDDGLLCVRLSERNSFPLSANKVYLAFMRTSGEGEAREYLRERYDDFVGLCACIRQRANTMLAIGHAVAAIQRDFFLRDDASLAPMAQKDVAAMIGVSASTVCRAIQNKYLRCRRGTYELRQLFARGMCAREDPGQRTSDAELRQAIRAIISAEDCRDPLSDADIARLLAAVGLRISRRTVAKYRENLLLPNTFYRKRPTRPETKGEL